jgi:hypothetical protein
VHIQEVRARGTHQLERQMDELVRAWKASEGHTSWRAQRDELVRTWKGRKRVRGTHFLKNAEGSTTQDTERE